MGGQQCSLKFANQVENSDEERILSFDLNLLHNINYGSYMKFNKVWILCPINPFHTKITVSKSMNFQLCMMKTTGCFLRVMNCSKVVHMVASTSASGYQKLLHGMLQVILVLWGLFIEKLQGSRRRSKHGFPNSFSFWSLSKWRWVRIIKWVWWFWTFLKFV